MTQGWEQGGGARRQSTTERAVALPSAAVPRHPGDPTQVGPYRVVGRLGAGGMGTVYLARTGDGTLVAVKVIHSDLAADEGFIARFRQEVEAARRVAPFCTARVLDADLDVPHPYLVTEFVDGVRLDALVRRDGPLPLSSLQGVAVGVAAALTAIHAVGLVHRDLKPNNVVLSYFGPRVIDFGIARALDAATTLTRAGAIVGTPGWMAPEQVAGQQVTPAADVFVWGTLVAYAGTGRSPFGDGSAEVLAHRIMHEQPDLTGLPEPLCRALGAAMAKQPERRPSAQRLVLDLTGGAAPEDPQHAVTEVLQRTWVLPPSAAPTEDLARTAPFPQPSTAPAHLRASRRPHPGSAAAGGSRQAPPAMPGAPRAVPGQGADVPQPSATAPGADAARGAVASHAAAGYPAVVPDARAADARAADARAGSAGEELPGAAEQGPYAQSNRRDGRRWPPPRVTSRWPPPVTPPQYPATSRRSRRPAHRRSTLWRVLLGLALVLLVVAAISWNQEEEGPGSTPGEGAAEQDTTPGGPDARSGQDASVPEGGAAQDGGGTSQAVAPGVGIPVRDGTFEFVVQGLDCGSDTIGNDFFNREAQGQYCLVGVQVTNVGDRTARFDDGRQRLYDAEGNEYRVLSGARFYLLDQNLWDDVNPGNTVSGSLVYDVPEGFEPDTLRLQESLLSPGVVIRL